MVESRQRVTRIHRSAVLLAAAALLVVTIACGIFPEASTRTAGEGLPPPLIETGTSGQQTPFPSETPLGESTPTPDDVSPASTTIPTQTPADSSPVSTATVESPSTDTEQPSGTVNPSPVGAPPTPRPPSGGEVPGALPSIVYFRSDVLEAVPGDTIRLTWMTTNAVTVTLWHLAPTGQFSRFWTVDEVGSFDYQSAPSERNRTTFALSVANADGTGEMATVSVSLSCPDTWFFVSAPDICPQGPALSSAAAEQHFERGVMIWVADESRIYILFDDGQSPQWNAYQDQWFEGLPDQDPSLSPPAGYYQPVRGFGLVWREQPGIRERLGWAIEEEQPFVTTLQRTSYAKYNEFYLRARDGLIWRLEPERSGWDKISDNS